VSSNRNCQKNPVASAHRGWGQYFNQGTIARAYPIVNNYVERRVRHFLRQRHQHSTVGTRRFSSQVIFGELGVARLSRKPY